MNDVLAYAPTIGTHNSQHVVCFLQTLTKWVIFLLWFPHFSIWLVYVGFIFGLAYQGKNLVFIFIIKYNSLRDFGP
jgi:hypothetical protein